MADDVAVIYRRYRPEIYWSKVIKIKHKNYSRHNADGKTTKRFSNAHEPCSNATLKTSKSSFYHCQDIIITVKQNARKHKRKKSNGQQIPQRPKLSAKISTRLTTDEYLKILTKKCSTPIIHDVEDDSIHGMKRTHSDTQLNTSTPYQTKFIVNTLLLEPNTLQPERQHVLNHPLMQAQLRIYRCQLSTTQETCCCSCNSDAMFEVMKSLYDCYKKKNCDNCNCVLCGHLPKEERRQGEARKSLVGVARKSLATVGVETDTAKQIRQDNLKKAKEAGILTPLAGKTREQREKILKGLANLGLPLPEGKTSSQKALIDKVRQDLGLPPTPKSAAEQEKHEKAAKLGLLHPLEGKSKHDKEKLLNNWHDLGIELPEGRTASEKAMIANIKKTAGPKEKMTTSKAAGLLTPLEGKTPEQKEKILRSLAQSGLPLPTGTTESEKKRIAKVAEEFKAPLLSKVDSKVPAASSASEKLRRAKAAGLLTTLDKKTPEQREKILRGLAMIGLPLPEGKTPSVIKLLGKVRNDLGMPPEPKTIAEKEKYTKAQAAGLIKPLEGKTPAEKEKILRALAEKSIPLPIGRTPSEKALIKKILAGTKQEPSAKKVASQKFRKATLAGLSSPLQGKTPEQKEKILRDIAMNGGLLPDGNTPSEIKLINKVRKDLGLPPTPKSAAEQEKQGKAAKLGLLHPLEGKSKPEKEKLLRNWQDSGIELPEGRTASEKSLIANIKKTAGPKEKMTKSKAAGLLTPLEGKTPEQKEKILRGLAQSGLPLPTGTTESDKKLIAKVAEEFKAPLPSKVDSKAPAASSASEKLRRAKVAGLLTTLDKKTPEQREKILRGLAMIGLPLPEGKTPSVIKLLGKIRNDLGMPPEPKTIAEKEKYTKAQAAGLIKPLEGKTPAEKEKILRALAEKAIPLPIGRTPSEKALIKKILAGTKQVPSAKKVASEKLRKAVLSGLSIPLQGKTPEQKEKILRDIAMNGGLLPDGNTPSEIKLINKVRKDLGLPPKPKNDAEKEKYAKAQAAGLMVPLEAKTPEQKEKILKKLAEKNISLPEGRTASEKSLIKKIQADVKSVSSKARIASERLRKAKAAGLAVSLTGKPSEQKAQMLHNLAKRGYPLPQGKTASEKARKILDEQTAKNITEGKGPSDECICHILAPESKSEARKSKSASVVTPKKSKAAGLLSPLESKSAADRERVLRDLVKSRLPLAEGKTKPSKTQSGKLKKIPGKSVVRTVSSGIPAKTQSAKLLKAKAAGLLTPLNGKDAKTQEKILKGLLKAGLPLPEGTTNSEKALIKKVQDEFNAAKKAEGLSPKDLGKTDSAKIRRAKASGLVSSLKGKTLDEKQKILKDLIQAGLPLPKVTTPSEKEMVKKIKADAAKAAKLAKKSGKGLPVPEGGDTRSKRAIRKSKGARTAVGSGIEEEIQEIVKTDKCNAACGCDKKKIRFKHSYVKIRVTSPDISSFCPCPNECIPSIKPTVFAGNEGIKVTVGSVGVPSYTVHPQTTKRSSHENNFSLQPLNDSLLKLKISLIGSDTDDLNSSKSMVYIFNSESDVSISDIERLLRLTLNNDNVKFKTSGEKKPVSYIYPSWFSDNSGNFRSSLKIAPSTLNLSTSSLRSLYTNAIYKTESCLSHTADLAISMTTYNMYDSDTLSTVSYPEKYLKYSSQSINTLQTIERLNDMDTTSTNTLPRTSQSYVTYSNRKIDIRNYLGEFSSQFVAKGDMSCASLRSLNSQRGIKRNMLEHMQKALSNKSLSSSDVMAISSSGHGDGSSHQNATDTLPNLTHSEASSLLLMNNRPHVSLLALNMLICAKLISKAEAQRDLWKKKKAKAVLRLRNMAQKLLLQMQKKLERRRSLNPHVQVCTSTKYTSSIVASQKQKHVEHTLKKTGVLCCKWMARRGNRAAYHTKHIDTRIHSFSSPSSYFPSTSTVSTTPLLSSKIYVNSQVTTNSPVSNVEEILSCIKTDDGSVKMRKKCTFAKRVGEIEWNSPSFSVHRMKTCY